MKQALMVVIGMLALVLVAACGNSESNSSATDNEDDKKEGNTAEQEEVEFSFFFTGSANVEQLWKAMVPAFEKAHPNIKVDLVHIPTGQSGQATLDNLVAAKKANQESVDIDLYEGLVNELVFGEKEGIFEKVDETKIPNLANVQDTYMETSRDLGVPFRANSVVLAYNKEKVENPPTTTEEMYDWIQNNPGRFAYNDPATGGSGASFVITSVYNYLDEEAMSTSDPSVMEQWGEGFEMLKELEPSMYQEGVYPKTNQGTLDLLANGEVDMIPAWSDMALEQIDKGLLPESTELTQIDPPFTGGPAYLMVPKLSQKKDAVYTFIDFVLSPEGQQIIMDKMYGYPAIEWSNFPEETQKQFEDVDKGYRFFQGGELHTELMKRWQNEIAAG